MVDTKVGVTRIFRSFGVGEKTISIVVVILFLMTLTTISLSLSAFFMSDKNRSVLQTSADLFDNGKKYSYDYCFACIPSNSLIEPPDMYIKGTFNLKDPNNQKTFLNNPITFSNVYLPKVNYQTIPTTWSTDWFNSKIRLADNSDIQLTDYLITNSINSLQIGYFDYIDNSTTTICTTKTAEYSSIYYAIDNIYGTRYMCICVMSPQYPLEGCKQLSIPTTF